MRWQAVVAVLGAPTDDGRVLDSVGRCTCAAMPVHLHDVDGPVVGQVTVHRVRGSEVLLEGELVSRWLRRSSCHLWQLLRRGVRLGCAVELSVEDADGASPDDGYWHINGRVTAVVVGEGLQSAWPTHTWFGLSLRCGGGDPLPSFVLGQFPGLVGRRYLLAVAADGVVDAWWPCDTECERFGFGRDESVAHHAPQGVVDAAALLCGAVDGMADVEAVVGSVGGEVAEHRHDTMGDSAGHTLYLIVPMV